MNPFASYCNSNESKTMMDRYEPAFLHGVNEIDFLRFVKDVDDQDVLDSLSVLRRRAGLTVTHPLSSLQMDSSICCSESSSEDSVVGDSDEEAQEDVVMAIYRVQIQVDNGLATHNRRSEVSRYAFDATLQQDYLEEFDYVSLYEDNEDNDQECLHQSREEPERHASVLSSWLNKFLANADNGAEPTQNASWSASLNQTDSTEFQGTLNALSSIFSGIY